MSAFWNLNVVIPANSPFWEYAVTYYAHTLFWNLNIVIFRDIHTHTHTTHWKIFIARIEKKRQREREREKECTTYVASANPLRFIPFSSLQLYIRKAKGKTKTVDVCSERAHRGWKRASNSRPPLSGEGRIEGKIKRRQKILSFRTRTYVPAYAYGRASFRFSPFSHGLLCELSPSLSLSPLISVYSVRKREASRSQQKGKYLTDPIHLSSRQQCRTNIYVTFRLSWQLSKLGCSRKASYGAR